MSLIFANIIGYITLHWKLFVYALGAVLVFALIVVAFKSCGKREVKIDLESVEKINNENQANRKKELEKIIENNADTIRTNDNRTAISEVNNIERDRKIKEKVDAVDAKILEIKSNGKDATAEEIHCLLDPLECK